jgi:dienelactone hydrolase
MADVVLFHSVLGVRAGVTDAAERMRAMGHAVHIVNLYEDGVAFDDYEEASKYVESIGSYPALMERSRAAVQSLPADVVYAGFSNGGGSAEYLGLTRAGAKGVLLFAAAVSLKWFTDPGETPPTWPSSVPVQVHYMLDDPYRENDEIEAFAASVRASGAPFALYDYPGTGHLFTDASLPAEYDAHCAELQWQRVELFLRDV